MKPIYPYIAVEKIEDEGNLVFTTEEKPVVKVVQTPGCAPVAPEFYPPVGSKILVNHVDEYPVGNKIHCFVRLKDIVAIV